MNLTSSGKTLLQVRLTSTRNGQSSSSETMHLEPVGPMLLYKPQSFQSSLAGRL